MHVRIYFLLLSILFFRCSDRPEKLFLAADSTGTGIHFSNKIAIGDSLTLNGYEYIYNGGGVAIGDINNDGIVNSIDWSVMNLKWNTNDASSDLNVDGTVNAIDFSILNGNWFKRG